MATRKKAATPKKAAPGPVSASKKTRPASGARATPAGPRTLAIDIGGTGIKMLPLDAEANPLGERARELTPQPSTPDAVLAVIEAMLPAQGKIDRVSVGFPGVVVRGIVRTAPNLGTKAWRGFELRAAIEALTGRPTRALNDAELQGYGVIKGHGVEMALTLGTGLGTALYSDGHLVPNFELAHHPLTKGKTYEERVSNAERQRVGNKKWRKRVGEVFRQIGPIFNCDAIYVAGGNTKKLGPGDLPEGVQVFSNVEGLAGAVRIWDDPIG